MSANVVPIDPSDADESDTDEGDRSARAWVAASIAVGSMDPCVASSCSRLDVTASMPTLWRDGGMRSILSRSPPAPTATATGTDYWVATYKGDSNTDPVSSGTAAEPVTITAASPSISTSQEPASAAVGSSIADRATVSGGYTPAGTVTFSLYNKPNGTDALVHLVDRPRPSVRLAACGA